MDSKSNQILIGVILLLLGIFSFAKSLISIDYGAITMFTGGMAFILLYRMKRQSWSLIVGGYILYFALASSLRHTWLREYFPSILGAMFFIVPGIIFLVLYFDKNKKALLLPGCVLIWQGVFTIFFTLLHLNIASLIGISIVLLGISFAMAYYLGRYHMSRAFLYLGVALFIGGLLIIFGFLPSFGLDQLISCMLIAMSIVIILRAIRKK